MDPDRELQEWTSDWRAGSATEYSTEVIRRYAQARDRRLRMWRRLEFAIAGVALPVLAYLGWIAPDIVERVAMWLLALITLASVAVAWWNWRGPLLASTGTTAAFVAASAQRLRRMRQAWRLAWLVLAAEVAVFSVWISNRLYSGAAPPPAASERFAWGWLLLMTVTAIAYLLWMGRWVRRDAERFEALKQELLR